MSTQAEFREGYFQALAEHGVSPSEVEVALRLSKAAGLPNALIGLGLATGAGYLGGAAAGRGLFELTEPQNRDKAMINDFKRRQVSDDLNAKLLALRHQRQAQVAAPVPGGVAQ